MAKKNKNNQQPQTGANSMNTEFGAEQGLSKKARKKAARESRKENK